MEEWFNKLADFYEEHNPGCLFAIGIVFACIAVALFMSVEW